MQLSVGNGYTLLSRLCSYCQTQHFIFKDIKITAHAFTSIYYQRKLALLMRYSTQPDGLYLFDCVSKI